MTLEKRISKIFNLQGENWKKHANPWSVWTRFATLPFIALAIWARVWIGWYALIPIALLMIWIVINPTLFSVPKNFDSWGARAVLGEKFWSERKERPVRDDHKTPVLILTMLQGVGSLFLTYGLWKLDMSFAALGTVVIYLSKMWFLDRMVWIFEDMKDVD